MHTRTIRHSFTFVAFATFLFALAGCGREAERADPPAGAPAKPPEKPLEVVACTVEQLAEEHLNGPPSKVMEKYKDKLLEVAGVIQRVSPAGRAAKVRLLRAEGDDNFAVDVYLRPWLTDQAARSLAQGQRIKATGKYGTALHNQAGQLMGLALTRRDRMVLEDAEYVELNPGTLLLVTLDDLVKDVTRDPDAARNKYDGKEFIVEARVAQLLKEFPARVVLKHKDPRVECSLGDAEFPELAIGQEVRIRGACSVATKTGVYLSSGFVLRPKQN